MEGKGPSNGCLLGLIGLLFAALAVSFAVNPENRVRAAFDGIGIKYPLSLAIIALVAVTIFAFAVGSVLKAMLLRALPVRLIFKTADLSDFPDADEEAFARYTTQFEAMGFEREADYNVTAGEGAVPPGFARLFRHPVNECFAEVNQAFPADQKTIPVRSMIGSVLSDGWSVATTDREPDSVTYMLRRPRGIWSSYPGMKPEELLKVHLGFRERLASELRLRNVTPSSASGYFAYEQQDLRERRELLRRKNIIVGLLEMLIFSKRPKHEWLGE